MKTIEKLGFVCPYCMEWYEDRDDAISCIEDCIDADSPDEDTMTFYVCECCGAESKDDFLIQKCEARHDEKEPNWRAEKEMRGKLTKAALCKFQRKLS